MSQLKVDAHKKEKAGRKEQVAKQKKVRKIGRIIAIILCLALVALVVFLVVRSRTTDSADTAEDSGIELSTDDQDYTDVDISDLEESTGIDLDGAAGE